MNTHEETGIFQRPDGTRLFWRLHQVNAPKALIALVHGVAEHSGRYDHVVRLLTEQQYAVLRYDHRGHGQSSGTRVFVERFRDYSDDLHALTGMVRAKPSLASLPFILIGHSMGGLIAADYLTLFAGSASGAILSAPGFGVGVPVPSWKVALGRGMSKLWPKLAVPTGIGVDLVSRDAEVVRAYEADPLVTNKATARWFTEFTATQERVTLAAPHVKVPVLLLVAGSDKIVSVTAQEQWFAKLGSADKQVELYPALYHELFNEPEKDAVFTDLSHWLAKRWP